MLCATIPSAVGTLEAGMTREKVPSKTIQDQQDDISRLRSAVVPM